MSQLRMFYHLFGAVVNAFFGNVKSAKFMETFTLYMDMVDTVFKNGHETCWNEASIARPRPQIVSLKSVAPKTFSKYHPSDMLKQKWHTFDHICEAFKKIGVIKYLHVGVYEASQKCSSKCMEKRLVANEQQ